MGKRKKKNFFKTLITSFFTWRERSKKERERIRLLKRGFRKNKRHAHKHNGTFSFQKTRKSFVKAFPFLSTSRGQNKRIQIKHHRNKGNFFRDILKGFNKSRSHHEHKPKAFSLLKKQELQIRNVADVKEVKSAKRLRERRKKKALIKKREVSENLTSSYTDFRKAVWTVLKFPMIIFYVIRGKKGYTLKEISSKVIAAFKQYKPISVKTHNDQKNEIPFFKKIVMMFKLGNKNLTMMLRRRKKTIEESIKTGYDNTKSVMENEVQRGKFIFTAINSTAIYILAFLFIYIIYQVATVLVASHFNIASTLFFYGIRWPGPDSTLWTFDSVIAIFLAGPLVSLLMGVFLLAFFYIFIVKDGFASLKLFFVWSYIHAFNLFFGAFIVGVITEKGFGYAQDWLYLSSTDKYIISTIFIFILALIGFFSTSHFLQCALSNFIIRKDNRILFIFSQVFVPWLLGSFLILLIKTPKNTYHEALIFMPLVFVFLPIFPNYFSFWTARIKLPPRRNELHIDKIQLILLTIALIIFRVVLNFGIPF